MAAASERLDFEQSRALLRTRSPPLKKVAAGQKVVVDESVQMDVMAFAGPAQQLRGHFALPPRPPDGQAGVFCSGNHRPGRAGGRNFCPGIT